MYNSDQEETIYVESTRIFCDGGSGELGHPAVYLNFGEQPQILCPYCSRRFALTENTHTAFVDQGNH